MVSKRKRNGEVSLPNQPQMSMNQQPDMSPPEPVKKTRTNPPRSAKATSTASELRAKAPAVKKSRASRAKKPSAPTQPTTSTVPAVSEAGPSQPAAPPTKKGRKKAVSAADTSGSQTEKRGAVFKSSCPQNIFDRVERVMAQRCVVFTFCYHTF